MTHGKKLEFQKNLLTSKIIRKKKLTLAPIWLPHWPAWMWTISLIVVGCVKVTRGMAPGQAPATLVTSVT